ncbi:MAG: hypothetical protein VYC39_08635 [Myxococcota bacterium]|nr:hypothetical protein [Myxococcota bacterium]
MTSQYRLLLSAFLLLSACSEQSPSSGAGPSKASAFSGWPDGVALSGVPLDQYCETLAKVDCGRLQQCAPNSLRSRFGTRATCQALQTRRCHGDFVESAVTVLSRQGLVDYSPNRMARALENYSRQHCDTQKLSPTPFSALEPRQQIGQPCSRHAFCRSGYCTENTGRSCGECETAPPDSATECPEQCPVGERCECQDNNCGCAPTIGPYSDCSTRPNACNDGSTCLRGKTTKGNIQTVCVPFPRLGEACGVSTGLVNCVGDAICINEVCSSPEVVLESAECNQTDKLCDFGLDCRGVCISKATEEEACIIITQQINTSSISAPTCEVGACRETCQAPLKRGEICLDTIECEESLGCMFDPSGRPECISNADAERYFRETFVCP